MSDIQKNHAIGAGTGAVAGAVAGAAVGTVAAGPIGMAAGAVVGGILGAKAGDSLAEVVNPTDYSDHWRTVYQTTPYYAANREWSDYEPAYQLGYRSFGENRGRTYDEIEAELERNWDATRGPSKLAWVDARPAVRDGWHYTQDTRPVAPVTDKN